MMQLQRTHKISMQAVVLTSVLFAVRGGFWYVCVPQSTVLRCKLSSNLHVVIYHTTAKTLIGPTR